MSELAPTNKIQNILKEYDEKKKLNESFLQVMESLLVALMENNHITINSIQSRLKNKDSLEKKINKKNKYSCLNDITDICGIRISTFYSDDVDKIAKIIETEFEVDTENTIDKRKSLGPDRFGYLSLHYIVALKADRLCLSEYRQYSDLKFEIQIRTILQNVWAEIEHDLGYKSSKGIPTDIKRDFSRLAGLLELADKEFLSIRDFLSNYKATIEETISSNNELDIIIDNVSLDTFFKSETFNNHVTVLAQQLHLPVENFLASKDMDIFYRAYEYLGINTIEEVNKLLEDASSFTEKAFKVTVDFDEDSPLDESLIDAGVVYFSMYFKVIQDGKNVQGMYNLFKILGIIVSEMGTAKWFDDLRKIYKELKLES